SSQNINCDVQSLSVLVRNEGISEITNFTINYSINGDASSYEWTGNIASLSNAVVDIPNVTLVKGSSTIEANLILANDTFSNNNNLSIQILNNDNGQVGVLNTFETEDSALLITQEGPEENIWERGTPTGALLNATTSGINAYGTNLSGNY